MTNPTSKTVTPSEIRLAVEWLAANANGVSLVEWEPRSQTLLTAADQIEAMASVGIRQERRVERLTHELAVQKMIEDAMTDCIQPREGQTFEERAEELIVTEVQHQQCSAVETTDKPVAWTVEASHDKSLCQPFLLRQDAVMYAGNKRQIHPGITWTLVPLYRSPVEPSPDQLVDALQDRVHKEIGITRPAHAVKATDHCPTGDYPCQIASETTDRMTQGCCIYCGSRENGDGL